MVGIDREDIQAEKVSELGADDLIRLFSIRLATFNKRHNLSRERCIGEVALEFRDDYQVNILRVLDERDYIHPDGYAWNIQPFDEDTIRKYDPVLPESIKKGGTADVSPGDILKIGDDGALIVGVDEKQTVVMNKSGKLDTHSLATIREVFNANDIEASLIRDGEIIRGVDTGNDCNVQAVTDRPNGGER